MANNFAAEVKAWKESSLTKIDNKCREIVQDLFTKVVDETPVNKLPFEPKRGQLVAGWNIEINGFDLSYPSSPDPSKAGVKGRINSIAIGTFKKNVYITFTNNVEYVMKAERLGWANTDPYMMVAKGMSYITAKYGA